ASVHHADVIVAGSLTAGVAERVWGEGVWLQWLGADAVDQAGRRAAWQATAASILASITPAEVGPVPSIFGARTTSLPPPPSAPGFSFKHLAGGVFKKGKALFTPRSHAPFPEWHPPAAAEPTASAASAPPSVDLRAIRANLTDQQRKELVARLGVPMSSINAWIEGKRE
ncbi:MAG TPA: hypothetical protein VFU23_02930, partial [Gemmatimonadales bacterium]|nr:hypothetical protein [Gemmatimonadales bacterium]